MTLPQLKNETVERFEKEIGGGLNSNPAYKEQVKSFLLSSLTQIRQETLEEMKREIKNWDTDKLGLAEINNGYSAIKLIKESLIEIIQSKK